jgi:phosphatidate cytidylyltransferase
VNELIKRTITGAVYVALTLGAAFAGPWTTLMLFLPVCGIAANEFHALLGEGKGNSAAVFILSALATMVAFGIVPMAQTWTNMHAWSVALAMFAWCCWNVLRSGTAEPLDGIGAAALVIGYIAIPFGLLTWLLREGPHPYVGFMILLWTNDTGAYLSGRAIGRTKLMPSISPKKTVEGLAGGIVLAIGMAWLLSRYWQELTPLQWIAAAVAICMFSTLGDLLESAFKRARGVKDSGTVLPGHGGILDRFDGFLLAAPAMLLVIHLFEQGA